VESVRGTCWRSEETALASSEGRHFREPCRSTVLQGGNIPKKRVN
jgi:hypothetical protein